MARNSPQLATNHKPAAMHPLVGAGETLSLSFTSIVAEPTQAKSMRFYSLTTHLGSLRAASSSLPSSLAARWPSLSSAKKDSRSLQRSGPHSG